MVNSLFRLGNGSITTSLITDEGGTGGVGESSEDFILSHGRGGSIERIIPIDKKRKIK